MTRLWCWVALVAFTALNVFLYSEPLAEVVDAAFYGGLALSLHWWMAK